MPKTLTAAGKLMELEVGPTYKIPEVKPKLGTTLVVFEPNDKTPEAALYEGAGTFTLNEFCPIELTEAIPDVDVTLDGGNPAGKAMVFPPLIPKLALLALRASV